jgi:hypothetical protein
MTNEMGLTIKIPQDNEEFNPESTPTLPGKIMAYIVKFIKLDCFNQ